MAQNSGYRTARHNISGRRDFRSFLVLFNEGAFLTGFGQSVVKCMSQLQDHVTIIIGQCGMLEDIFSDRSEVMTAINVIKNAAHRIATTINSQSQAASEIIPDDQRAQSRHSA